jgi:hypothetical protein
MTIAEFLPCDLSVRVRLGLCEGSVPIGIRIRVRVFLPYHAMHLIVLHIKDPQPLTLHQEYISRFSLADAFLYLIIY